MIHRSSGPRAPANLTDGGILPAVRTALRVIIAVLVIAAFAVAIVPLLVLLDLGDGGTGWGLCADGVTDCRNGYFAGFELIAVFMLVMFGIILLIAFATRLLRRLDRLEDRRPERQGARAPLAALSTWRDRLGGG